MINPESLSLLIGVAAKYGTDYLKHAEWFKPVAPKQIRRVQALAGCLSAVVGAMAVWGTGGFNEDIVKGIVVSFMVALQSWGVSFGVHELTKVRSDESDKV